MSIFPRISLKPDVADYLRSVFLNKEVLAAVGHQEAECRFQKLLTCLSHPPSHTCVRASTHLAPLEEIRHKLAQELEKQMCSSSAGEVSAQIVPHPRIPDVLLLPVDGPRPVKRLGSEVVVGAQCGSAVLRGAHVFVPGIVASPKYMKAGDAVSVLSDSEGRCTRGATSFQGSRVFVGNGVAQMDRSAIFCTDEPVKGIGVRMVEPLYQSPSFDGVLPDMAFLQNLPSVVVGHVLGPRPGERILDMCAAPGGKTCHIAALMRDQGEVVALDRIRNKIDRIRQNAQMLHLRSIKVYCFDSTRAVSSDPSPRAEGPPFPPESFDRVLLDAPCSGLGQRPNMSCTWSLKEICSYQPLQRKLFQAVGGAAVEERRGSRVQHLHCDSIGERGADRLGPGDLPLPHAPASGASHRGRGHAGSRPVARAAAPPPEVQSRAHLGPDGDGGPPPLRSRRGHHRLLHRQVPENLTYLQRDVFSPQQTPPPPPPPHTHTHTHKDGRREQPCLCYSAGAALPETLAALFTASAS